MTDVHGFPIPKVIKFLPVTETGLTHTVPERVQKNSTTALTSRHRKAPRSVQPSVERLSMPGTEKVVQDMAGTAIPSLSVTMPGTSIYSRTWIQSA